jgi:hypothetical protein
VTRPPATNVARSERGMTRSGCLLRALIGIAVIVAAVVIIGETFDQGDSAKQPPRGFDAGPADGFATPSVNQIEEEHLFVVRLPNGEFRAFYDKSARQQELNGDCRILFDDTAGIGALEPIAGVKGAFVEDCEGSRAVWRADGVFAFGASYGDLDQYGTSVDANGDLIVDVRSRSCTRSKGAPGVPPYEVRRCGTGY